jgi:hypothetical protein
MKLQLTSLEQIKKGLFLLFNHRNYEELKANFPLSKSVYKIIRNDSHSSFVRLMCLASEDEDYDTPDKSIRMNKSSLVLSWKPLIIPKTDLILYSFLTYKSKKFVDLF